MSVRKYNKDHLKEHAGVRLSAPVKIDAPESDDPLVFWTQDEKDPCEVNLNPFATGQANIPGGGKKKFNPFAGHPELIHQLAPAIEETLLWATKGTVAQYIYSLRVWWRILDAVEAAAATAGQPMRRVEDVRLLTNVHSDFAHRSGMSRHTFNKFRALVDS